MKYLNGILTVIALALCGIAFLLFRLNATIAGQGENSERVVQAGQSVVASCDRLEGGLTELRKEITELRQEVGKRFR